MRGYHGYMGSKQGRGPARYVPFVDRETDVAQAIAAALIARPAEERGGTFDAVTGMEVPASSGYALAAGKEFETTLSGDITKSSIQDAVKRHLAKYKSLYTGDRSAVPVNSDEPPAPWYIGAWQDGDVLRLEPSEIVNGRAMATVLARKREQKAIYDFAARRVVYVKDEPEYDEETIEAAGDYNPPLDPSPVGRHIANANTLAEAFAEGRVALVETEHAETGELVAALAVASKDTGGVTPFVWFVDTPASVLKEPTKEQCEKAVLVRVPPRVRLGDVVAQLVATGRLKASDPEDGKTQLSVLLVKALLGRMRVEPTPTTSDVGEA